MQVTGWKLRTLRSKEQQHLFNDIRDIFITDATELRTRLSLCAKIEQIHSEYLYSVFIRPYKNNDAQITLAEAGLLLVWYEKNTQGTFRSPEIAESISYLDAAIAEGMSVKVEMEIDNAIVERLQ